MEFRKYLKNLTEFIESLQLSDTKFLYFQKKLEKQQPAEFVATINTNARKWNNLYIIPCTQRPIDYCYIYSESELKYDIEIDDNGTVLAYEPSTLKSYGTVGGGIIQANWGNHLTIGILNSFVAKKPLLNTHITTYHINEDNHLQHQREISQCNIFLNNDIPNKDTFCIKDGIPKETTLQSEYKDDNTIKIIQDIHKIITKIKGGKKYIQKIFIGKRGGSYIIKNNKRSYLKGGARSFYNSIGFKEDFANFIEKYIINAIANVQPRLLETIIIDNARSEYIVIRYIFGENELLSISNTFIISKDMIEQNYNLTTQPITPIIANQLRLFTDLFLSKIVVY